MMTLLLMTLLMMTLLMTTLLLMTLLLMTLSSVQVDARVTGVTSRRDVSSLSNHYHR